MSSHKASKKRRYPLLVGILLTAVATVMSSLVFTPAHSGFTASINNPSNIVGTGTSFLTASRDSFEQCSSVPTGNKIPNDDVFSCRGDQLPSVPISAVGKNIIDLQQSGTISYSSAAYKALSCGPVNLVDNRSSTNPMLSRGNVTFNQPGPTQLSSAVNSVRLNGVETSLINVKSSASLQTFSTGIWFKTDTAAGALFSWSTAESDKVAGSYDRSIYFTSTGALAFSTFSGSARTITSSGTNYADNAWHYAVATAQSNVTASTSKSTLYVDGVPVASNTFNTATIAQQTAAGYWHVGQGKITVADGYSGSGANFKGWLSNFSVQASVYTDANVSNLYSSGSYNNYNSRVLSYGPQSYWVLNDTGLTTYAGPYPIIGSQNPCTHVNISIGTDANCVFPYSANTACSDTLTNNIAELVAQPYRPIAIPTTGNSQKVSFQLQRNTNYNADFDTGLKLLVPSRISGIGFKETILRWSGSVTVI